jgi:hypothetical protein
VRHFGSVQATGISTPEQNGAGDGRGARVTRVDQNDPRLQGRFSMRRRRARARGASQSRFALNLLRAFYYFFQQKPENQAVLLRRAAGMRDARGLCGVLFVQNLVRHEELSWPRVDSQRSADQWTVCSVETCSLPATDDWAKCLAQLNSRFGELGVNQQQPGQGAGSSTWWCGQCSRCRDAHARGDACSRLGRSRPG